jgi:hypothetical protein
LRRREDPPARLGLQMRTPALRAKMGGMRRSRRRTTFSELSTPRRIGIVLLGAIQVSLLVAAQVDIQRRPAAQINGSKTVWRLICLLNTVGPLSYFRWGRRNEEEAA